MSYPIELTFAAHARANSLSRLTAGPSPSAAADPRDPPAPRASPADFTDGSLDLSPLFTLGLPSSLPSDSSLEESSAAMLWTSGRAGTHGTPGLTAAAQWWAPAVAGGACSGELKLDTEAAAGDGCTGL